MKKQTAPRGGRAAGAVLGLLFCRALNFSADVAVALFLGLLLCILSVVGRAMIGTGN
jgi:hypothetical protein